MAPRKTRLSSVRKTKIGANRVKPASERSGPPGQPGTGRQPQAGALPGGLPWPIEMVPLQRLRPAARNPKTHPEKQIEQLVRNIAQFGFTNPAVADESLMLIAGHARTEAAKRAGLSAVPVIIIAGLSEPEKRALALADNKLAERGGWLRSDLAVELSELAPLLEGAGLDLELTGFEASEVDALMGDFVDAEQDSVDDVPSSAEGDPTSRPGDLWLLGSHRLRCGDATDPDHVRELMGRERAVMVFTDPPYNVRIQSVQGRGRIRHREFMEASGEKSRDEFVKFLIDALSQAAAHSIDGSIHFVCMDWRHAPELHAAGERVYTELKNICVWVKSNAGMGTFYRSQHELIFAFKSGEARHVNNFELGQHGRSRSNVWTYAGANSFRAGRMDDLKVHPTVKPVPLVADAMRDCSRRGDVALDPFMGSGTTILAAERVGRRGFGLELDPIYVDVAVRRWQSYTKRDATLAATGQTFDEVARERASGKSRVRA
jgi:DNA modification methylase